MLPGGQVLCCQLVLVYGRQVVIQNVGNECVERLGVWSVYLIEGHCCV